MTSLVKPEISQVLRPILVKANSGFFAVFYCGNHQYHVTVGDVIAVQRIRVQIGTQINLKKVLMIGGKQFTAIGRPFLSGAQIVADVEEQKRMRNTVSFFAPHGRRQMRWKDSMHPATILRIRDISYSPEILGELDKYQGILKNTFDPNEAPNPVFPLSEPAHSISGFKAHDQDVPLSCLSANLGTDINRDFSF